MIISNDERERAVFRSRRMYQTDYASNLATAEDRGIAKGRIEGMAKGIAKGEANKALAIAKNLLGIKLPVEQIVAATGLTRYEVEGLRNAD